MLMSVRSLQPKLAFKAIEYDRPHPPTHEYNQKEAKLNKDDDYKRIMGDNGTSCDVATFQNAEKGTAKIDLAFSRPGNPKNGRDEKTLFELLQINGLNPRIVKD